MSAGVEARSEATVTWRPMREDDLPVVGALEQASHAAPWTQGNFRDAFAAGYGTLIGELDGGVVAYGVLMLAPGEAQLLNLTVAAPARRQGLGRRVLQRLLADALGVGAKQCFLEVRESNHAAIALYLREGFAPVARRVAYYPPPAGSSRREDALVMRRRLANLAHG
ncbi:MAG: ribosomal protein S18-alanine N-acetyltransferase [Betaproteobacteria bacterium]